jgi:hypothetical protein
MSVQRASGAGRWRRRERGFCGEGTSLLGPSSCTIPLTALQVHSRRLPLQVSPRGFIPNCFDEESCLLPELILLGDDAQLIFPLSDLLLEMVAAGDHRDLSFGEDKRAESHLHQQVREEEGEGEREGGAYQEEVEFLEGLGAR